MELNINIKADIIKNRDARRKLNNHLANCTNEIHDFILNGNTEHLSSLPRMGISGNEYNLEVEINPEKTTPKTPSPNTVERTQGEWEASLARWAPEAPVVGFVIKCGKKQIASFNVHTTSQILDKEVIERFSDFKDEHFSHEEAIANAAYIVKAVNNHSALVEALQRIINNWDKNMMGDREEYKESEVNGKNYKYWSPSGCIVSSEFISAAREAISKATKQ